MSTDQSPVSPGEILKHEFLEPLDMSARQLAEAIGVPGNRISRIIAGDTRVTADTAMRLAKYYGTSEDFWVNLQSAYDLELARQDRALAAAVASIQPR